MLEALDDPIEIMIFGFELPDRGGRMGGDQDFFSGFAEHRYLDVTIGFRRHILFELIEQFDVFVRQFEYRAPDLLARRRHHAGEAAPPLRRPAAELNGVVGSVASIWNWCSGARRFSWVGLRLSAYKKNFIEYANSLFGCYLGLRKPVLVTYRLSPAQAGEGC